MRLIPLKEAMVPKELWRAWEQMDDRARAAVFFGRLQEFETQIDSLEKRIGQIEETMAENEEC